jgi:seryl-tRNA synthetase
MSEKTKKQTLVSIQRETERAKKTIDQYAEKQAAIRKQTAELNGRIKELERLSAELRREELVNRVAKRWFGESKMTEAQVAKLLELGVNIRDKIDILDVDAASDAVYRAYENAQSKAAAREAEGKAEEEAGGGKAGAAVSVPIRPAPEGKVTIGDNFSGEAERRA